MERVHWKITQAQTIPLSVHIALIIFWMLATTLIGGLIQPLMAGYLLDGNTTSKGPYTYSPILCSQYSMNATAEALVTFPGYKIVLYQNTNYTGTSVPYDNFSGTTTICSTLTPNFYSSCKVYYRSDSNEVTIANIS